MQKAANRFINKPWKHAAVALLAVVLAYAAASWAIDSGRLTAYAIAGILLVIAAKHAVWIVRKVNAK